MQVIVHRTESDWTANGIRLGGERNPIGRRTESDWTANASGGKTKEEGVSKLSYSKKITKP